MSEINSPAASDPRPASRAARFLAGVADAGTLLLLAGVAAGVLEDLGWPWTLAAHWLPVLGLGLAAVLPVFVVRRRFKTACLIALALVPPVRCAWPLWSAGAAPAVLAAEAFGGPADHIRIAEVNLFCGRADLERVATWLRAEADLAVIVEVTSGARDALVPLLAADFPHFHCEAREAAAGIAFVSRRWPIRAREVFEVDGGAPQIEVDVLAPGGPIRILALHLWPPVLPRDDAHNRAVLDAVRERVRSSPHPVVVAGDFNLTPWCSRLRDFLDVTNLRDLRRGRGFLNTWPETPLLPLLGIPIDHVLVRGRISAVDVATGPWIGSDHRPYVATFDLHR